MVFIYIFFSFVKCLASELHVFCSGNDRSLRLLNRGEGSVPSKTLLSDQGEDLNFRKRLTLIT